MDDGGDAVLRDQAGDQRLVAGFAGHQRNPLGDRPCEAGGQVVDYDDAFARFHQRTNRVTSDIAGAAGDQHTHELTRLPIIQAMLSGRR